VFVTRAKELQDVLGEHQDAVVAEARIRAWAATAAPVSRFAAGRLVQLERGRQSSSRAAWPAAWARLDRAARKAAS
jgi:CHAD domain-containing protein